MSLTPYELAYIEIDTAVEMGKYIPSRVRLALGIAEDTSDYAHPQDYWDLMEIKVP
jgi:hypothetical protein